MNVVNYRNAPISKPCSQLFFNVSCFMLTTALFPPPLIQTQCLQVCLSNVIHWSGIPSIPAAVLSDNIIYTLHCHAVTLIHWLSFLIHCRVCSFTFRCALPRHMCTNLLHPQLRSSGEMPLLHLYSTFQTEAVFENSNYKIPRLAISATQHSSNKHPKSSAREEGDTQ